MTPIKNLEDLIKVVNKLQEQNVPLDTEIAFMDSDYNYYDIAFTKVITGKEEIVDQLGEEIVDNLDNVPEILVAFYVDA